MEGIAKPESQFVSVQEVTSARYFHKKEYSLCETCNSEFPNPAVYKSSLFEMCRCRGRGGGVMRGGTNYRGPTILRIFLSFSVVSLFVDCTN
jgi:hypothetical protein